MKHSSLLLATVLVERACFGAGLEAGMENGGVREVTIDIADAPEIGVTDLHHAPQVHHETLWKKVQYGLVEQQLAVSSQNYIDSHNGARNSATSTIDRWTHRWIDFLNDSWLNELLVQCERDLVFKAGVTQNLSAMQAFVAFVSIGYAIVAMWLGPIKLTRWQRRSVLVTYTAAGVIQAIFLAHAFSFLDVHYAYPSTLALVAVFFVAFNVTNALLVLESEEPEAVVENPVQQIVEASSTRVITAQRAACF
ncbi:hypothetical protein PHYPSEUDO_009841 [Phytophthora pseudosyringae]|uniref:Uncharacterized protein n=1 Tax=Phytophthora pseudosyringae TaxID=221518 RepID=A0A8T1WBX4_9STRA|nr:hypothetical protein PHYPSEUDO_009841 [Phytophthora pseudosyringae]